MKDAMSKIHTFETAILELQDIARLIEREVGKGLLSADIRDCAKRVNELATKSYGSRS